MLDDLDLRDVHTRHEPDAAFRLALRRQVQAIVGVRDAAVRTDTTEPSEEELIMLTDTRTEVPGPSPRTRRWFLPAVAAVLAALIAGVALTAGDDGEGETPTASSSVVFHDDFSDAGGDWETLFDSMRVEDGHQVWTVSPPGQIDFLRPAVTESRLTDMEVTAAVASVDPDSTVGVYCRKGVSNQDFYYFFRSAPQGVSVGVVPPGSTAPVQMLGEADVARPDGPFELTARCVDEDGVAQLTMLIDGDVVLEATHDEPLPEGFGALEVQAGPRGSAPSEVRWDEFTVSSR